MTESLWDHTKSLCGHRASLWGHRNHWGYMMSCHCKTHKVSLWVAQTSFWRAYKSFEDHIMSLYHNESLWGSHRVTVVAHKVIVKVTLRCCECTVIRRAYKLWWRHIDCEVNANSQRGHYESLWGHTKLLWGHTSDLNAQSNCESHRVSMRAHIVIGRSHTVILSTQRILGIGKGAC